MPESSVIAKTEVTPQETASIHRERPSAGLSAHSEARSNVSLGTENTADISDAAQKPGERLLLVDPCFISMLNVWLFTVACILLSVVVDHTILSIRDRADVGSSNIADSSGTDEYFFGPDDAARSREISRLWEARSTTPDSWGTSDDGSTDVVNGFLASIIWPLLILMIDYRN